MATAFGYHEHAPPTTLGDVVLSFWAFEASLDAGNVGHHTVWPDGCTSVAVALVPGADAAAMCIGATAEARRMPVTPGARYFGVRFWPDTGAALIGYPASLLRDAVLPLPATLGTAVREMTRQLEQTLRLSDAWPVLVRWAAQLSNTHPPDATVRRVVQLVSSAGGDVRVTDLAAEIESSTRTLQRRFLAVTGLTIKEYARIRRLRTALDARLHGTNESWSALAAEFGYADQSHLIREFTALAGHSPREVEQRLATVRHHNVRA